MAHLPLGTQGSLPAKEQSGAQFQAEDEELPTRHLSGCRQAGPAVMWKCRCEERAVAPGSRGQGLRAAELLPAAVQPALLACAARDTPAFP